MTNEVSNLNLATLTPETTKQSIKTLLGIEPRNLKIIAVEGLDKAGKHTQSNKLAEALTLKGYNVVQSEFHRYETPTGKLIRDYLYKQYDVDILTAELIMLADKTAQQKWFTELEEQGVDFLILDRYTATQYVYGVAKGFTPEYMNFLMSHLVYQPDFEIFLDISAETSMKRAGKHGANDRYESNRSLLEKVRLNFLDYFSNQPNRETLLNIDNLDVDAVHEQIKNKVFSTYGIEEG